MLQTSPIADTLSVEAPTGDRTVAVFDTVAAEAAEAPMSAVAVQAVSPSERAMLSENKLPVVLAVVLIVWAAWLVLALRTDRRLARIERSLNSLPRPGGERELDSRDL